VTFAFVVTAAVQIVGVYLVFASLILPALATRRLKGGKRLLAGYIIGSIAFVTGIVASALLDLPTGAITVWALAIASVIAGFAIGSLASGSAAEPVSEAP
jgi:zinc/manganese transport system permease protein